MKIWYLIPTADPILCGKTFALWKGMGYMTAALTDGSTPAPKNCDKVLNVRRYCGYPWAVNQLLIEVIDDDTPVFVTGGDDILPDPKKRAEVIAQEFMDHFKGTWGVMQPTGDRWMASADGTVASERICGSPWMGRDFITRINGGSGPFWLDYFHFYCDEEMKNVTEKLGILWQRPDLSQIHNHWCRPETKRPRPEYLVKAKHDEPRAKELFEKRKAAGFPGHEPTPVQAQP